MRERHRFHSAVAMSLSRMLRANKWARRKSKIANFISRCMFSDRNKGYFTGILCVLFINENIYIQIDLCRYVYVLIKYWISIQNYKQIIANAIRDISNSKLISSVTVILFMDEHINMIFSFMNYTFTKICLIYSS